MSNAYSAYSNQQANGESLRITEGRALLRCAAKLEAVQNEAIGYMDYCEAVRQNQKLWTIFQASLMEPDSGLPLDLRNILKGLSLYVDRRSLRAYVEHKPELLNVLISINKQIAAGLMQPPESAAATPAMAGAVPPAPAAMSPINIAG